MLQDLTLYPGGHVFGTLSNNDRETVRLEMSEQAHALLFEPIVLADGVILRDLFSLLERDPLLVQVLRRDFAEELLAHVQSAPKEQGVEGQPWPPVEYLAGVWDVDRLAYAMIPPGTSPGTGVVQQARVLVADLMRQLALRGELTLERLRHGVKAASVNELSELLTGTEAASHVTDPRLGAIRLVAATYLAPYEARATTQRPYDPQEIEYLELFRLLDFHTGAKTFDSGSLVHFHGVGFELREDTEMHGYTQEKGTRTNWSISLTDVRELLPLPLRYQPKVTVCENDLDAKAFGHEVYAFQWPQITLGDLLHSVLWELSFHGAPTEQQDFRDELLARKAEVDESCSASDSDVLPEAQEPAADSSEEPSKSDGQWWPDLMETFDQPGVQAVFEAQGDLKVLEITRALRKLDDDADVMAGLADILGDRATQLVIRPAFSELKARALRKVIRETKC